MKILFLSDPSFNLPSHLRGGARFLVNICQELGAHGNKVDVLSWAHSTDKCFFASVRPILKTLRLSRNKYDLFFMGILVSTGGVGMYLLSCLFRIPLVILLHGYDMDCLDSRFFFDRFCARLYLKHAKLILVNSEMTRQKALLNGVVPSKIKVLNPGVDTDYFTEKNNLKYYRDKYDLNGKKIILTVSRLVKRKGHKYVIEALAGLKEEMPDMHYLVVGEGPEYTELARFASEKGVPDRVTFIGPVDDGELPYYYSLSEIFVMPVVSDGNDYEGFGMVYLEANACGIPVIGSRSGGTADAIVDQETGVLIKEKDVAGLGKAIKLLLEDKVLRRAMAKAGRRRAEMYFSWKAVGNKLEKYLEKELKNAA